MTGGRRAGVLGSPIAHSLSPVMHRAAYAHLGVDWAYERYECDEPGLEPFLAGLDDTWAGLSLTMPLKEEALRLADRVDPVAQAVGGANTLVHHGDSWVAYNTDVAGIRAALAREGVREAPSVLLLGSGATARSVIEAVHELGAEAVTFATRSGARAESVAFAQSRGLATSTCDLDAVRREAAGASLVVNTMPGRAADAVAMTIAGVALPPLFEVIYEGWPTALAQVFLAAGAPVASGLVMLAEQGAEQVRLFTGQGGPELGAVMLAAAQAELARR